MEKIGLSATLEMAGFNSGASSYNNTIGNMTSATEQGASKMQGAFSAVGNVFQTAMGMISAQAIIGVFNSITGSLKSFVDEAMGAERITAKLDAALTTSGRNYEAQMKKFEEASKTTTTVMVAVGKALKPEEIEKYGNQLEKAKAQMLDMQKAMSSGKPVTETQKVSFKQLGESIADLESKLAGGGLVAKTISLAQAQGLVPPVMQASREQIDALAAKMSQLTEYDDEAVASAAAVSLKFKNIGADVFPDAMAAAADLAATMGTDLSAGMQQLGIALEEPGEALGRLSRQGVNFDKAEIEMLKTMNDTGRAAEAQRIILDRLKQSIGGAAEAMGKTASGQITIFKNNLNNVKEAIGGALLPAIGSLADFGSKAILSILPYAVQFGETISGIITPAIKGLIATITRLAEPLGKVFELIGEIAQGFVSGIDIDWLSGIFQQIGIGAPIADKLAKAFDWLARATSDFSKRFQEAGGGIRGVIAGITSVLDKLTAGNLGMAFSNMATGLVNAFEKLKGGDIKGALDSIISGIKGALMSIDWKALGNQILTGLQNAFASAKGAVLKIDEMLGVSKWVNQAIESVKKVDWAKVPGEIGAALQSAFNSAKGAVLKIDEMLGVSKWVNEAVDKVKKVNWAAVPGQIRDSIVEAAGKVTDIAEKVANAIGLTALATKVGDKIKAVDWAAVITDTGKSITDFLNKVIDTGLDGLEIAAKWTQDLADKIGKATVSITLPDSASAPVTKALGDTIWKALVDLEQRTPEMAEGLGFFIGSVLRLLITGVAKLISIAADLIGKIITGGAQEASDGPPRVQMEEIFDRFLKGALEGLVNKIDVKQAMIDFCNKIATEVEAQAGIVVAKAEKLGNDIIKGMAKGLEDTWGSIKQWFTDRFAEIPAWAKSILGISSPSTVFAEIGIDIMLGLAEGLQAGEAAVVSEISDMIAKLSGALSGLVDAGAKIGQAEALPDLAAWFEDAKPKIKALVDAINIFFDVEKQVSAGGLAYAADLAEHINRLFTALAMDWSQFTLPEEMPDLAKFASTLVEAVRELSGALAGMGDQVMTDLAQVSLFVPALQQVLSLLGTSLAIERPPRNFRAIFDEWLSALGYAALTMAEGMSKASDELVESLMMAAEISPILQQIMGLLGVSLSIEAPPRNFQALFDAWLTALGYAAMTLTTNLSHASDALIEALEKAAAIAPLIQSVVGILSTSMAVEAPPANFAANFDAWLTALAYAATTLVSSMGRASEGLIADIERAAAIVEPLMAVLEILSISLSEFKLPTANSDLIDTFVSDVFVIAFSIARKLSWLVTNNPGFEAAMDAAEPWIARLGSVLELLAASVEDFKLPTVNVDLIDTFVSDVFVIAFSIARRLSWLVENNPGIDAAMDAAEPFIGRINALLELLSTEIAEFKMPADPQKVLADAEAYVGLLASLAEIIQRTIPASFTTTASEIAVAYGNALKSLMDGLTAGFAVFEGLRNFVAPAAQTIDDFLTAVKDNIFTPLYDFAVGLDEEQLSLTSAMAGTFGALFGGLKDAFDILTGIRSYVAIPAGQIKLFFNDVRILFRSFYDEALLLEADTLDITQKMGEVVNGLLSGLKDAFDLFENIRWYTAVPEDVMQTFLEDVKKMFVDLRIWASSYGTTDAFTLVNAWSEALAKMMTGLKATFDLLEGVASYEDITAQVTRFLADVKSIFGQLATFAGSPEIVAAMPGVHAFVVIMQDMFGMLDMVLATMDTMRSTAFPEEWIPEEVIQMLANMYTIVAEGIQASLPEVGAAARSLGQTILASLPLPETMFGYGWALGDALARGIRSAAPDLGSAGTYGGGGGLSGYLKANTTAMQHIANLIMDVRDLRTTLEIRGTINVPSYGSLTLSERLRQGEDRVADMMWGPS